MSMNKLLYILLFFPFTFLGQNFISIEQDVPLELQEGWNIIGFTCYESIDVIEALSPIVDNVIIVKDNEGSAYLPEFGFNGIGNFQYGLGYQLKTNQLITDFQFCSKIVPLHPQYQIGDIVEGGIVFYVDETGQHGLVAALEDLEGTYEWGCYQEYVDGANSKWIGSGLQNTMDITNDDCQTQYGGITAAQAALDAEMNDYSDWYLPSHGELYQMFITIGQGSENGNIGGFSNDWYWSSSEGGSNYSWYVYFINGVTSNLFNFKYDPSRVRVIRAF